MNFFCYIFNFLRFVVRSHIRHHSSKRDMEETEEPENEIQIPQEMLKKYIVYARENIHPKLQNMDQDKVANIYSQLRQESLVCLFLFFISILISYRRDF